MRFLIVRSVLLATAGPSLADCRRSVKAVVVKEKVVVVEKPVLAAVFVPLYAVGYAPAATAPYLGAPAAQPYSQPPGAAPVALGPTPDVQVLLARVQQLEAELQRRDGVVGALPAQSPVSNVFVTRCASCHDAARAKEKGGEFAMLRAGKVVDLDPDQLVRVLARSHDGTMPPAGPNLTQAERDEVAALVRERLKRPAVVLPKAVE